MSLLSLLLFLSSLLPFSPFLSLSLPLSELSPYRKHRDTTFFSDTNDSVDSVDVGKQAQVVLQIRLRPLAEIADLKTTLHSAITLATLTSSFSLLLPVQLQSVCVSQGLPASEGQE